MSGPGRPRSLQLRQLPPRKTVASPAGFFGVSPYSEGQIQRDCPTTRVPQNSILRPDPRPGHAVRISPHSIPTPFLRSLLSDVEKPNVRKIKELAKCHITTFKSEKLPIQCSQNHQKICFMMARMDSCTFGAVSSVWFTVAQVFSEAPPTACEVCGFPKH